MDALTDVEKTIIDCFDLPRYSGGYTELIRAFNQATMDDEKLMAYSIAVNNGAVIKRHEFLATLFEKGTLGPFVTFAGGHLNDKYNALTRRGLIKANLSRTGSYGLPSAGTNCWTL